MEWLIANLPKVASFLKAAWWLLFWPFNFLVKCFYGNFQLIKKLENDIKDLKEEIEALKNPEIDYDQSELEKEEKRAKSLDRDRVLKDKVFLRNAKTIEGALFRVDPSSQKIRQGPCCANCGTGNNAEVKPMKKVPSLDMHDPLYGDFTCPQCDNFVRFSDGFIARNGEYFHKR